MTALVKKGQEWMAPLMDFRSGLVKERNLHENRMPIGRKGNEAVIDGRNTGPYWPWYRAQKLRQLLEIQYEIQKDHPEVTLITNQELIAIQVTWNRDGYFDKHVGEIFREVYKKDISTNNMKSLGQTERRILKEVCNDQPEYYHLIDNLIEIQESKTLLISKFGLHNDVEKQIERFVTKD
jgi:DNA sulfur modification protein DndC